MAECSFFHFYLEDPDECQHLSNWQKQETGSIDCHLDVKQKGFQKSSFKCGTVGAGLSALNRAREPVAALPIDVEGFEKEVLEVLFRFAFTGHNIRPPFILIGAR
jgi:hypothetical protein